MKKIILLACITLITFSTFSQKKFIYHSYAFDNEMLNGKIKNWGPSFIEDELLFTVDLSKSAKYNYVIKFGEQSDIEFIGFMFTEKTCGSEDKHIYPGHIKIKGAELKNCVIMSTDQINKYFLGNINETSFLQLIKSQNIEIRYDDIFGNNIRYLYPIKLKINNEDSDRFWEEEIRKIDEKKENEHKKLDSIQRKRISEFARSPFGEKRLGNTSEKLEVLSNRKMIKSTFKRPKYKVDEHGIVVVDLIISPIGDVIEANIGKGTNTSSKILREASLKVARQIKFEKVNIKENERRSITYNFRLN